MAKKSSTANKVNIRPGVSVLSVLKNLNYKPWFALAEFVDNSIQSFIANRGKLKRLNDGSEQLVVEIDIDSNDEGVITIRDNAAGISRKDFPRAFRPAQAPSDRSGLCEFGMGMKSAACWFSPYWSVRTSALGETEENTIEFDIDKIVEDEIEELRVHRRKAKAETHFTEIELTYLHHIPKGGRTLGKIKSHLTEIYRVFTREGTLRLILNGEELAYELPEILHAPEYTNKHEPRGKNKEWRKEIDFDFGDGLRATGFVALRAKMKASESGFSLFRRKRLIQGSFDEKYKPREVCGDVNKFLSQRLFGEIHLEGFDVSHTKDGFQWGDEENAFLDLLKEELNKKPLRLLSQGNNFRAKPTKKQLQEAAEEAVENTADAIECELPPVAERLSKTVPKEHKKARLAHVGLLKKRLIKVAFSERNWEVVLQVTEDPAVGTWLDVSDSVKKSHTPEGKNVEVVGLRLSLAHPFMERFVGADVGKLEPMLRVAAALGIAEKIARDSGGGVGQVRINVNKILKHVLCHT